MSQVKRQPSIELLRGVLMLMIVLVHLTGNSALNAKSPIDYTNPNWFFANIIDAVCYSAVDCFILISGYFGLRPTVKKFLNLEIPVIIYGIIACIMFNLNSLGGVKTAIFPVITKEYWFYTGYVLLLILAPAINSYIEKLSRQSFLKCLTLLFFLFVILPSFTSLNLADSRGMDFVNFAILYMIGRYIRLYAQNDITCSKRRLFTSLFVLSVCVGFGLTVFLAYKMDINKGWASRFYAYNNILVYIQAVCLFFLFKDITIKSRVVENLVLYLSPSFFFVYIIHESPIFKPVLYKLLGLSAHYYSQDFFFYIIGCGIFVFIICIIIDILLRRLFMGKLLEAVAFKIEKTINRLDLIMFKKSS